MKFFLAVASSIVAFVSPESHFQNSPGYPLCQVCGEGKVITVPDELIPLPGVDPQTCVNIELGGVYGFIEEQYCPIVPQLIENCKCAEGTLAPTAPVASETDAPSAAAATAPAALLDSSAPVAAPNATAVPVDAPIAAAPASDAMSTGFNSVVVVTAFAVFTSLS
jgi:hypothetical protein